VSGAPELPTHTLVKGWQAHYPFDGQLNEAGSVVHHLVDSGNTGAYTNTDVGNVSNSGAEFEFAAGPDAELRPKLAMAAPPSGLTVFQSGSESVTHLTSPLLTPNAPRNQQSHLVSAALITPNTSRNQLSHLVSTALTTPNPSHNQLPDLVQWP
jgi:hypothetical protein